MEKLKIAIAPLSIILFAVVLRLVPHPPNFTPIAAMALFGGAYLDKKYALALPLVVLFISDIFLGFHGTMVFVYGTFLLIGLMGVWLSKHKNLRNVLLTTICSSVLFFVITNLGVWLEGRLYPRTLAGLIDCYVLAIPFFRNTILGDMLYVSLFFGSFELAIKFFKKPAPSI